MMLDIGGEVAVRCTRSMHSLYLSAGRKVQLWKQHALQLPYLGTTRFRITVSSHPPHPP